MFDKNLIFRDGSTAGALSATGSQALDFGAGDRRAITYEVIVPIAPTGTTPTLDVKIEESDDNVTFRPFLVFPQINAEGVFHVTGKSNGRYRKMTWTLGGTTPNFGAVTAGPVFGGLNGSY